MILSGRDDNFRFRFPKTFVPEEIEKKYSVLINRIPGCPMKTVIDFINFSMKSVEMDVGMKQEQIEQIDRGTPYGRISRSDAIPDMLWAREINIIFQLDALYLIWFIMSELYLYYYCCKDKYIPKPPGMEILDVYDKVIYRVEFTDMIFKGLSGLTFDMSNNTIEQKIITTNFAANKVTINLEPSKA